MATPDPHETSYYALRPRTPVRAWAVCVLLVVVGVAAGLVGWSEPRQMVLVVGGVVAVLAGLALGITAATFVSSWTLHIVLTPEGYEVSGPGYHKSGSWVDVDAVSTTPDGSRLVIAKGLVDRTFIQCPGGEADERMRAVAEDITARLRALET